MIGAVAGGPQGLICTCSEDISVRFLLSWANLSEVFWEVPGICLSFYGVGFGGLLDALWGLGGSWEPV